MKSFVLFLRFFVGSDASDWSMSIEGSAEQDLNEYRITATDLGAEKKFNDRFETCSLIRRELLIFP